MNSWRISEIIAPVLVLFFIRVLGIISYLVIDTLFTA
jgi:hypothetical protein